MDVPPPAVPSERLDGWRRTEATIEEAFSTPVVTVYTHTVVYEEIERRERIADDTGVDQPWRFFFVSRIRLDPDRDPSRLLTSLVRRKATAGFVDRLEDRGIEGVSERDREESRIGDTDGLILTYGGAFRHQLDEAGDSALLSLPVAALLAVWDAGGDYHVAGGAYPDGPPDSGPPEVVDPLAETVDPASDHDRVRELIDGCGKIE
jgi:hypothetical protein